MDTKLTLVMDEAVIKTVKSYAKKRHTSLSKMVERYFVLISGAEHAQQSKPPRRGSLTSSLAGAIRTSPTADLAKSAKELIGEARMERFG